MFESNHVTLWVSTINIVCVIWSHSHTLSKSRIWVLRPLIILICCLSIGGYVSFSSDWREMEADPFFPFSNCWGGLKELWLKLDFKSTFLPTYLPKKMHMEIWKKLEKKIVRWVFFFLKPAHMNRHKHLLIILISVTSLDSQEKKLKVASRSQRKGRAVISLEWGKFDAYRCIPSCLHCSPGSSFIFQSWSETKC